MNIEDFTTRVEQEFEEMEPGTLTPDMDYRDISGWSSMYALILIAMISVEYGFTLTGEDLQSTRTVRDLFNLINRE